MPVQLPLDHLQDLWPTELRGARVGALLHPASVSSKLEHASQTLEKLSGELFQLRAFFGPQHGFLGQTQDNMIEESVLGTEEGAELKQHGFLGQTQDNMIEWKSYEH